MLSTLAPRSTHWLVVSLALALLLVTVPLQPQAAEASRERSLESSFVQLINQERASRGIAPVGVATDIGDVAYAWSAKMQQDGRLQHNPNFGSQICCWRRVSENVGWASGVSSRGGPDATVRQLHSALMNSDGHRRNILDPNVDQVGVGVDLQNDRMYITQNFRQATSSAPPSVLSSSGPFSDVPDNSTHASDIARLHRSGVTSGCGNGRYCPRDPVTREQMASFLVRALDLPRPSGNQFRDVSGAHAADVNALAAAGITKGCNPPRNDRFCPNSAVDRQEMATFIVRSLPLSPRSGSTFRDVRGTHRDNVNALARAGITKGCNPPTNDRFCPSDAVTRDQMATFLVRAFNL